jgi:hypothetical protein
MSDPRLNSGHLLDLFDRRESYRRARDNLLGARGWLTMAGEKASEMIGAVEDWPSLAPIQPDQILPSTKYVLVDHRAHWTYPLKLGLNTIGRLPDNDIVFEEIWISRRHCVILVHARGGCELHDTASRNGTFLNGTRICEPAQLTSGDRIKVCDRPLRLLSDKDYRAGVEDNGHHDTMEL